MSYPVTQVWGEGGSGTTLQNVTAISAGAADTSMALKADGTVSTWGYDMGGNLGNGTSDSNSLYPVKVLGEGGSGDNYPDALSVSSVAALLQLPILLVQKDGLSDAVRQEISAIKPSKVFIIGGEGAISSTAESQVAQLTGLAQANIVRIGGADRYATSLAVARYFNLSGQNVCLATGGNFPDALAGRVYAASHNAPIILADGSLSDQVMNYLRTRKITGAAIFGGEAAVGKDIEQQLGQLIGQ